MNARLRARLVKAWPPTPVESARKPAGPWPHDLPPPVDPQDTANRIRAQSLLCGQRYRDGTTNPDTLTHAQALDVLAWAASPPAPAATPSSPRIGWRRFFFPRSPA